MGIEAGSTRVYLGVAIASSIVLSLISAANRIPWSDEGQFSSAAYNLAHHGFMGTTVLDVPGGGLTRIGQRTYWILPLYLVGQAAWYKIGPASLLWTRAFSIAWGLIALLAFHRILSVLFPDPRISALATSLLALDYSFIDNAGFARPDLMCLALGLCSFAAYLTLRQRDLRRALTVANALLAAAGLTHPNALLFLVGLAILIAWFDRRRFHIAEFAVCCIPYVLLGLPYLWYVSRDPVAWLDQLRANGANGRFATTLNPFRLVSNEIVQRYFVSYGLMTGKAAFKSIAIVSFVIALVSIAASHPLRTSRQVRLLLVLLVTFFGIQCVFNQKLSYYLVQIIPLYIGLFSIWFVALWDRAGRWRWALAVWIAALVGIPASGILLRARERAYYPAESAALAFLNLHGAGVRSIIGSAGLLYDTGFDPRLRDDLLLGSRSDFVADAIVFSPLSESAYDGWESSRPNDLAAVRARLAKYDLAYRKDGYQIYFRR